MISQMKLMDMRPQMLASRAASASSMASRLDPISNTQAQPPVSDADTGVMGGVDSTKAIVGLGIAAVLVGGIALVYYKPWE